MHPNEELVTRFYTAFKNSDAEAMADCYHPDVEFSDPVFPSLKGKRAKAMWAMLGQRKADPDDRTFERVVADDTKGSAHWEAKYVFPGTGRKVHNKIDASFAFEGKIRRHVDRFDFWAWSRMAMGAPGALLGWGPLKVPVRRRLAAMLDDFVAKNPRFR